jgi:hypothetical protein
LEHDNTTLKALTMALEVILNCSPFGFWTLCLMKMPECQGAADQTLLEDLISTVKVVGSRRREMRFPPLFRERDKVREYMWKGILTMVGGQIFF